MCQSLNTPAPRIGAATMEDEMSLSQRLAQAFSRAAVEAQPFYVPQTFQSQSMQGCYMSMPTEQAERMRATSDTLSAIATVYRRLATEDLEILAGSRADFPRMVS